jgi:cytochrome P450
VQGVFVPSRFADPDKLEITRENLRHLQFGYGIHNCLGAFLARMETEIAIGSLLGSTLEAVAKLVEGKEIIRVVVVPGKIVNFVVR